MKKHLKINNFLKNNSSTILTVIGSIGVGVTAIMSARDTIKAMKRIKEREEDSFHKSYLKIDTKEKIKIAAPCYIPTIISGVSTILCICGSNKINKNVQKSLTSAYVLLDQSYKEYRKSVKEIHGEEGDLEVIKHTAERKEEPYMVKGADMDVFFDFYTMQFFYSTISAIQAAEKTANEMLETQGYVSLRAMHALLGEPELETDNLLGWSVEAGKIYGYDDVKIEITPMVKDDGSKYYTIDYSIEPTEDYLYLL